MARYANTTLNVVFIATEGYKVGLAAALRSVSTSCKQDVKDGRLALRFSVLDLGLAPETKHMIESVVMPINWLKLSPDLLRMLPEDSGGAACWSKLLLHRFLNFTTSEIERGNVLYLDCDIIVRKSLLSILQEWHRIREHNTQPPAIAAVVDFGWPSGHDQLQKHGWADTGGSTYFNAGVMCMDLDQIQSKEQQMFDLIREQHKAHHQTASNTGCCAPLLKYREQDVLNLIFQGQWARLPHTFNVHGIGSYLHHRTSNDHASGRPALLSAAEYDQLVADPVIVHFTGNAALKPSQFMCKYVKHCTKPWSYLHSYHHPFHAEFLQHLRATPWKDWQPDQVCIIRKLHVS